MKKILLLFPNTSVEGVIPLAVAILSAIAKKLDYDVHYFDTTFYKKEECDDGEREYTGEFKQVDRKNTFHTSSFDQLIVDLNKQISECAPDILAVSANSLEFDFFKRIIKSIDIKDKKPFTIIGGCHATVDPESTIQESYIDAICIGEGEKAWEQFLVKFKKNEDFRDVSNLWVKRDGKIYKNALNPLSTERELWETPLDFSFFNERHFLRPFDGKIFKRGLVELSRGCPYNCTYCVNSGLKKIYKNNKRWFRVRPLQNAQESIVNFVNMGAEIFKFQDECFFSLPKLYLKEFCNWYASEIRLPFMLQTRPESITEEKVRMIADMNIPVQISCGIESGSERILKKICNRKTTIQQIKEAYAIIKKYKIRSSAFLMIGFPTETREEVFQTISLIRCIKPDVAIMSVFIPFKGSPLAQYCIQKGYISGNEPAQTYTGESILKNQPMTGMEIKNLRRAFALYISLPEEYFPQIDICCKDYENNKGLFEKLVDLSWKYRGK